MRFFRNTALTLGARFVGSPAGLLTSIVLARALTKQDFGVLMVTLPLVGLVFTLAQLGVASAVIFRIRRMDVPPREVISAALAVTTLTWLVISGLAWAMSLPLLAWLEGDAGLAVPPELVPLMLALLAAQLVQRIMGAVARALDRFALWSQINVLLKVGRLGGLLLTLVAVKWGLLGAMGTYLVVEAACAALLTGLLLRHTGLALPALAEMRACLGFGLKSYAQSTAGQVHEKVDVMMLQSLLADPVQAGLYHLAAKVVDQVRVFPESIAQALYPKLAGLSPEEAGAFAARVNRHAMLWMGCTALGMVITGPWVLPLLYGQDKAEMITPFLVLAPAMAMYSVYRVLAKYFTALNRQAVNISVQVGTVCLNLLLNALLIPTMGMNGAAVASLVSYGAAALAILVMFSRISGQSVWAALWFRRGDWVTYTQRLARLRARLAR